MPTESHDPSGRGPNLGLVRVGGKAGEAGSYRLRLGRVWCKVIEPDVVSNTV